MRALSEPEHKKIVYSLDPRTKIFICLAMSVGVVFLKFNLALCFLFMGTFFYALTLGKYKVILVTYIGVALMWCTAVLFMKLMCLVVPDIPVTKPSLVIVPFLRVAVMINTILVLALSSPIQSLLTALKTFRLPIWLYIPSAVMIRFIPSFIKDVQQIHESMRIRGYSVSPFSILVHPVLSLRLMVAPIIFRALRSSDDLGIAAELKGVGYQKSMNNYKPIHFNSLDFIFFVATILLLAAGFMIQIQWGGEVIGFHP